MEQVLVNTANITSSMLLEQRTCVLYADIKYGHGILFCHDFSGKCFSDNVYTILSVHTMVAAVRT
jgi:hypothetical protein